MSASVLRILVVLLACGTAAGLLAAPASAFRLGGVLGPVPGNPAEALAALPADPEDYDRPPAARPSRVPARSRS